jgi:hypothetical protein
VIATRFIPALVCLTFVVLGISNGDDANSVNAQELVDVAKLTPKVLGFAFLESKVDPRTGFSVAGKNTNEQIRNLKSINGRPIADLEVDMRPGGYSAEGFLGKEERLLDVLVADNLFVLEQNGLTHQDLARPLLRVGYGAVHSKVVKTAEIRYGKLRLKIHATLSRGFQVSPFRDGTKTNAFITVENLASGKKLKYSLLVPHMIERYGFYEGKGTSYRVDPKAIIEVFELKEEEGP